MITSYMLKTTPEYDQGFLAGNQDIDITNNPYSCVGWECLDGLAKSVDWLCGFCDAVYVNDVPHPSIC